MRKNLKRRFVQLSTNAQVISSHLKGLKGLGKWTDQNGAIEKKLQKELKTFLNAVL